MRRFRWISAALLAWGCCIASVPADELPTARTEAEEADDVLSGLPTGSNVTPEMWFYMQEYRRHQSPKQAVRRKAELRASQRQQRLESQRWFGYTNLRPPANPVPWYGTYSPMWSGSARDPYSWVGIGNAYVTYHTAVRVD